MWPSRKTSPIQMTTGNLDGQLQEITLQFSACLDSRNALTSLSLQGALSFLQKSEITLGPF